MAGSFLMYAEFRAEPGERDALASVLLEAADVVGELPACAAYVVATKPNDESAVCVVEAWDSEEAHAEALERPEVRAVVERGRAHIRALGNQARLTPVGGHSTAL